MSSLARCREPLRLLDGRHDLLFKRLGCRDRARRLVIVAIAALEFEHHARLAARFREMRRAFGARVHRLEAQLAEAVTEIRQTSLNVAERAAREVGQWRGEAQRMETELAELSVRSQAVEAASQAEIAELPNELTDLSSKATHLNRKRGAKGG